MLNKKKTGHVYFQLFLSTLTLSAVTFGGGYVIVSLLKTKFVDRLHWIDEEEMTDLVAIAQASPGAIAVNGAIVLGYKLGGVFGVLVSVLGSILPPLILLSIVSFFYTAFSSNPYVESVLHGMQAGVAAIITSVVYDMAKGIVKEKNMEGIVLMLLAFILNQFFLVNAVILIIGAIILGLLQGMWKKRRKSL